MLFERHADRPVAVRAERPLFRAPPRIHEGDGLGDVLVGEHSPENREALSLGHFVGLLLDTIRLAAYHRREDDVRALVETRAAERLPDGIITASVRVSVEEVLRVHVPECLVELEEHFGVCSHLELLNRISLPAWQLWLEFYNVIL